MVIRKGQCIALWHFWQIIIDLSRVKFIQTVPLMLFPYLMIILVIDRSWGYRRLLIWHTHLNYSMYSTSSALGPPKLVSTHPKLGLPYLSLMICRLGLKPYAEPSRALLRRHPRLCRAHGSGLSSKVKQSRRSSRGFEYNILDYRPSIVRYMYYKTQL